MIAAVTARAFDVLAGRAPAGVEVRRLPDGLDAAAFVLPDWQDRETVEALPRLDRVRVVQALSAGTDWIESRPGPCSATPAERVTPPWPSGSSGPCSATPMGSSRPPGRGAGRTPRRAS